jgi:hypothetical protein
MSHEKYHYSSASKAKTLYREGQYNNYTIQVYNESTIKHGSILSLFIIILVYWSALRSESISFFFKCKKYIKCIKNVLSALDLTAMLDPSDFNLSIMPNPIYLGLTVMSGPH